MSKLFISYRRKSWPFTHRLADELRKRLDAEIFVDVDSIDQADFEKSIVLHLHNSNAVLLVVSEYTFTDRIYEQGDWVRREIREALTRQIPIVLVCVDGNLPPENLPADIKSVSRSQGINFYPEYFMPGVDKLAEFMVKIGAIKVKRPSSLDIMPKPFAWIDIPAGKVKLRKDMSFPEISKTFETAPFTIAKYPVTNAQFAQFVNAGGYSEKKWWLGDGWAHREKELWTEPGLWHEENWNKAYYPIVSISWYEAVAYCLWLSDTTGERIGLPTDAQWQRAAQGDDDRPCPWGRGMDGIRFNCSDQGITDVTQFEGVGDSPFGVVDMIGNVWEWCLTASRKRNQHKNTVESRILRGGSWSAFPVTYFVNAIRGDFEAHLRATNVGFRIVRFME